MITAIKKMIVDILATSCAVLLFLAIVGVVIDGYSIKDVWNGSFPVSLLFQLIGANILIHLGLFFARKFESKYPVLEYMLDIILIVVIILVCNAFFGWREEKQWVLVVTGIVVYIFGLSINFVKVRNDAEEMNKILQKRKKKNTHSAS
ncbi:hypothetical protein [Breznakiella homolactica]|uniref:DUF3021 family protein n=1 Tax=Breznakiella homolactica TaxID=2798577 RepID=A0A7T7XNR0_9SPIR|nr:hypothetical protein [Breznakiella homolactica]QQO09607.1 hypothetical protein JFL75_01425 [Breznakiella homolactica]